MAPIIDSRRFLQWKRYIYNGTRHYYTQQIEHKKPSPLFIKKERHKYVIVQDKQEQCQKQELPEGQHLFKSWKERDILDK
jgi:hypothetical protein